MSFQNYNIYIHLRKMEFLKSNCNNIIKYSGYNKKYSCRCPLEYKLIYKVRHDLVRMNSKLVNFTIDVSSYVFLINHFINLKNYGTNSRK